MTRTQAGIDRKLKNKVDRALAGASCRGPLSLIEMLYEHIVSVAQECLEMKDKGLHEDWYPDPEYTKKVGTLDGLVWSYCFCWVNAYEPHFTEARTRVRRKAIKEARRRINEE